MRASSKSRSARAGLGRVISRVAALPELRRGGRPAPHEGPQGTPTQHKLPDFLILGAQKCGTTGLFRYLVHQPTIERPSQKEVHYFDLNHAKGLDWYRGHFPEAGGDRLLTGEASPYYIFHPLAPARVMEVLPEARMIVLLRDPVRRAISHYHHAVNKGYEDLPLEKALAQEAERLDGEERRMEEDEGYRSFSHQQHSYVARGHYAEQLERWYRSFEREQIMVLDSQAVFGSPERALPKVHEFLGLPSADVSELPRPKSAGYPPPPPAIERRLRDYFTEPNRRLYELLGEDLGWEA